MPSKLAIAGMTVAVMLALPSGLAVAGTGGSSYAPPQSESQSKAPKPSQDPSAPPSPAQATPGSPGKPVVRGDNAKLLRNGLAAAPANAPEKVKTMIWAANKIQSRPYV